MKYRLFVYGTLKHGFRNHHFLKDATQLEDYSLEGADLLHLGGFPGLVWGTRTVHGEMYEITEDMLPALDRLEGVPYLYVREWVYEHRDFDFLIYLFNQATGKEKIIESGRWE